MTDVADPRTRRRPTRPGKVRRRPPGDPRPWPFRLRGSGWFWLLASAAVAAIWVLVYALNAPDPIVQPVDDAILRAAAHLRAEPVVDVAKVVAALGGVWAIMAARWLVIGALGVLRRWRHLVVFVAAVFALRTVAAAMTWVFGRPRPTVVPVLSGWQGYAHPSRPVAALTVALVGACYSLVPAGRHRRGAVWAAAMAVTALVLARVLLGVDNPSDALFAAILGVAFGVLPLRVLCPERIFPIRTGPRPTAHAEIDARRRRQILGGLERQLRIEARGIEPYGEEESSGSTPLRLTTSGRRPDVFAKLYTATHLRSDRWYKLARTILYGALEDEVAFNSVRQLVEYEDYMLRVMRDAGIPSPEPLGIVELQPEREYLVVTEFFERTKEADEATLRASTIHEGLAVVRRLWDAGLAHRDIKPGNVLVQDGHIRLVDVAFAQVRPSPWRQAVDLANMMLVLALRSDPETVHRAARRLFSQPEIARAFAAGRGVTVPSGLRRAIREDGRDLVEDFRRLAGSPRPLRMQRWSVRRIWLTVRTAVVVGGVALLLWLNLANLGSP